MAGQVRTEVHWQSWVCVGRSGIMGATTEVSVCALADLGGGGNWNNYSCCQSELRCNDRAGGGGHGKTQSRLRCPDTAATGCLHSPSQGLMPDTLHPSVSVPVPRTM